MLSKEEVKKIAELARLELTGKEIEEMRKDLSAVLDYFNSLKKVKPRSETAVSTTGVKQKAITADLSQMLLKKEKAMREDKAMEQPTEVVKKLIDSAPDKKGNHIKARAIL